MPITGSDILTKFSTKAGAAGNDNTSDGDSATSFAWALAESIRRRRRRSPPRRPKGAGLSLGDIPAGECRAIWIRRTANDTAAVDADGVTLNIEGDTAA